MFLEDIISDEDKAALRRIDDALDWSFSSLVAISGLRPECDFRHLDLSGFDFRGEDLRFFDFSGCDLTGCFKNDETVIDETTILQDATVEWIQDADDSIVNLMGMVSVASSSRDRRKLLERLVSEYRSPDHIRIFLRNQIIKAPSLDSLFDYLDFHNPSTPEDIAAVVKSLRRCVGSVTSRRGRNGRSIKPSTSTFSSFLDRVAESSNPVVREAFDKYLEKLKISGRETRRPDSINIESDIVSLNAAIDEAGGQKNLNL